MREIKFRAWTGTHILPVENLDWAGDGLRPYINETTWANPNTLMQYTGLIDANHKEVYEGDILKVTNPYTKRSVIKSVWWNGPTARFNGIPTSLTNVYEVIGNIHENPELLDPQEPTV